MALRPIHIFVPENRAGELRGVLEELTAGSIWIDRITDDRAIVRVLVDADQAKAVFDHIEDRFAAVEERRLIPLPVEATLPRYHPLRRGSAAKKSTTILATR